MLAWLPNINSTEIDSTWKGSIIAVAYIGTIFFLTLLGLTLHNFIKYLVQQNRWKVLPLLCFYLLAGIDLVLRCWTMIMVVKIDSAVRLYLPAIIRLLVSYTQLWTTIELAIRV